MIRISVFRGVATLAWMIVCLTPGCVLAQESAVWAGDSRAKSAQSSTTSTSGTGSLVEVDVPAPSLSGNLVGDAERKTALVYLPPSYDRQPDARFPVIYMLHGIFDSPQTWVQFTQLPQRLDALIAAGKIREAVVVMPDGGNRYGGGYYRNSPVSGNWADFIAEDLVGLVDQEFRTVPRAGARAVSGHSMGGYGAIFLGMTRPDLFGSIYAMSPCCLAPVADVGQGNQLTWQRALAMRGAEDLQRALEQRDFWPVAAIGLLAAFSPDPSEPPFHVAFPFQSVRGELVPKEPIYTVWQSRFPVHQIETYRQNLLQLRALAFDYGVNDQFAHIPLGGRLFAERLAMWRIPHRVEVFDGDHRELLADRLTEIVLPFLSRSLERSP
ncbi:MAG: alpha/beta fold hydrolase [Acidobacteriota bacterium]|nr:MAG: alpha/beta fold hydrolase [Acidobacteriota bacterium]